MSNFALDSRSSQGDIISSLNYALANLGTIDANIIANIAANVANTTITSANVVTANTTTGALQSIHTGTINYLYNYVNVKYANNATGSSGFSSNCTNKSYYGVHNTKDGSISSNPVDYQWFQVVGGFGTTKGLYHTTAGGGLVYFEPSTTTPSIYYTPVVDDQPIALQSLANSIVQTNTINPGAVTNVGIATQTITTNNMAFGIITADLLAANLIIAKDIVSTNANLGNVSSAGYWLQANSGSARFGGNVSIGNNLTIGNNAVIGGNLTVAGLITSANLNANTVQTTTIVQNAVSNQNALYDQVGGGGGPFYGTFARTASGYNIYESPFLFLNANTSIPVDAGNVSVVISGTVQGTAWVNANVTFSPTFQAIIYRIYGNGVAVRLPQTVTSTPAINLYVGNQYVSTTQNGQLINPVLLTVGSRDSFVSNSAQTITYSWAINNLTFTTAAANVTVANIIYETQNLTVSSFKR